MVAAKISNTSTSLRSRLLLVTHAVQKSRSVHCRQRYHCPCCSWNPQPSHVIVRPSTRQKRAPNMHTSRWLAWPFATASFQCQVPARYLRSHVRWRWYSASSCCFCLVFIRCFDARRQFRLSTVSRLWYLLTSEYFLLSNNKYTITIHYTCTYKCYNVFGNNVPVLTALSLQAGFHKKYVLSENFLLIQTSCSSTHAHYIEHHDTTDPIVCVCLRLICFLDVFGNKIMANV